MKAIPAIKLLPFMLIVSIATYAQRLPNVQKISLRAPVDIKIDGKASEWNNKFQAYNHATDVFYTIANDDDNLYLVIKASIPDVVYKIINGGITFTISTTRKRNDPNAISVTYPIFKRNNLPLLPLGNKPKVAKDSTVRRIQIDSFINKLNEQLITKSKEIGVKGVRSISDSIISIYNDEGLVVAERFNREVSYIYELSIPLKSLKLNIGDHFTYNIKLNGVFQALNLPPNAHVTLIVANDNSMNALSPTDFWAEYTLVAKPMPHKAY